MLICKKCKTPTNIMVDVTVIVPSHMYGDDLTKTHFKSKDVSFYGVAWDKATFVCPACGLTYRVEEGY